MRRVFRLWRVARGDLHLLWFALRHRNRPAWLVPAALLLGCYALEPFNFALPFLGVLDDIVVLPLALHLVTRLLPEEIHTGFARRAAGRR